MDWQTEVKLLGMKKTRLEAIKKLLDDAVERRKMISANENPTAAIREDLNINRLTAEVNRLNDEIFAMAQELGINPETGELSGDADRDCAAPLC